MAKYKIEGMKELMNSVKKLGKLPQKCVTKAAKAGGNIALKAAKKGGWIDQTGNMRRGIILKGERSRITGKKVYDTMMDPAMNDVFQKTTKSGLRRVTKGKRTKMAKGNYYYPASQEFGFTTVNGGYVPGFHFLKNAIEDNNSTIESKIVNVLSKAIDKELGKG